jgi:hypothetical protein
MIRRQKHRNNVRIVYPVGAGGQFLAYAISKGLCDAVAEYRFAPHEQGTNRWRYTPTWNNPQYQESEKNKTKVDASIIDNHQPWNYKKLDSDYIVSITPVTPGELFWCLVNSRIKNLYNEDDSPEFKEKQDNKTKWFLSEFILKPNEIRESNLHHDSYPPFVEYIKRIDDVEVDSNFTYSTWFSPERQEKFIKQLGEDIKLKVDVEAFQNVCNTWQTKQSKILEHIINDFGYMKDE